MKLIDLFESNTGNGYSSIQLDKQSSKEINSILKTLKITDVIDDLHLTLIYDKSNPDIDIDVDDSTEYKAKIKDIKMLGEPNTKWYAIALTLSSSDLVNRHKDYIKKGFKHSYPNFIPHLSLKYNPSEEDIKTITKNLKLFKDIKLIFSGEKLERVKD